MRKSFLPGTKSASTLVLDLQLLELLEIHVCGLSHPNNRKCYSQPQQTDRGETRSTPLVPPGTAQSHVNTALTLTVSTTMTAEVKTC